MRGGGKGDGKEECRCVSEAEPMGVSAQLDVGERGKSSEQLSVGGSVEGGRSLEQRSSSGRLGLECPP